MLTAGSYKPYLTIWLHVLSWILLGSLLLYYIPYSWHVPIPTFFWVWQSVVLFMMVCVFYSNALWVVPRSIIKSKAGLFVTWMLVVVLITQVISYIYGTSTHMHERMSALFGDKRGRDKYFDFFVFMMTALVMGISTSWAMLRYWQQAAQHKQQLEQDKAVAELAMLKIQINPHFFFNSLNSIYSLTYINVEDSRKALHTLSRMMRYLLYGNGDKNTTLLEEVDFLKNYISLMRLRSTNKVTIVTDIPDTLTDYPIAPMLLLPFIENAFKHGVDAMANSNIIIRLQQQGAQLQLQVVNNVFEKKTNEPGEGGIGLVNTERRLQLLYPNKHQLQTGLNSEGSYEVVLKIDLEP